MSAKLRPIGICDLCGGEIPHDKWFTSEGQPRLHCSTLCRNTANSRHESKARGRRLEARFRSGDLVPFTRTLSPEERHEMGLRMGAASAASAFEARTEGRPVQQNPTPRSPVDPPDPALLRSARAKRRAGLRVADLTADERAALNAYKRLNYRRGRSQRQPNLRLIEARRAAELTQVQLAERIGVTRQRVKNWEESGCRPNDPEVRRKVEELLGEVFGPRVADG